jgi:hypothetical protein
MTPGTLDPRITFTRASTATYFDSAGVLQTAAVDAPRWDYDPATFQLRGLLIEAARTNLLLNSAALSTQSVAVTAQAYALSFYGTGTITKSGTATGALIGTGAGQRVSQTFTPTAGSLTLTVAGTVSNAQFEVGQFPTSHIPTAGVAVTRSSDVAVMTGGNFSGWFNAAAGTFAADTFHTIALPGNLGRIIEVSDGTTSNSVQLIVDYVNSRHQCASTVATVSTGSALIGVLPALNTEAKTTASYGTGLALCVGTGGSPSAVVRAAGSVAGSLSQINLGNRPDILRCLSAHIRRLRYWPRELSDAEMQQITS